MGAKHRIIVRTHDGKYLTELNRWSSLQYGRFVNNQGWWMVVLPGDTDTLLPDVDRILEFYRKPEGGEERLEMVGFTRYWDWFESSPENEHLRMGGEDPIGLLDRRIIAHAAGSDESSKTEPADDMLKAIVRENMGVDAQLTEAGRPRAFPPDHFEVTGNFGAGPEVARSFAWRNVLDVLVEICEASGTHGTPLYFDVDSTGPGTFAFNTYVNSIGADRTARTGSRPVVFSRENNNIRSPFLRIDHRDEHNYVWGGGQGQESDRVIDPEKDLLRIGRSIWAKREVFQDAREESTVQGVADKAFERLQNDRPRRIFRGDILDTPQSAYGIDWAYGDKVTVRYKNEEFEGIINNINFTVDENGKETLRSRTEIDEPFSGN
jgi:hypothetical protein